MTHQNLDPTGWTCLLHPSSGYLWVSWLVFDPSTHLGPTICSSEFGSFHLKEPWAELFSKIIETSTCHGEPITFIVRGYTVTHILGPKTFIFHGLAVQRWWGLVVLIQQKTLETCSSSSGKHKHGRTHSPGLFGFSWRNSCGAWGEHISDSSLRLVFP